MRRDKGRSLDLQGRMKCYPSPQITIADWGGIFVEGKGRL